jgi:hypothetical protein
VGPNLLCGLERTAFAGEQNHLVATIGKLLQQEEGQGSANVIDVCKGVIAKNRKSEAAFLRVVIGHR